MSPEHIIHLHSLSMPSFMRRSKAMAKAKGPLHLQLSFPIHYHLFLGLTNLFIFIYIFLYIYQFSRIFLIIFIFYLPDNHLHPPPDNHPHPDYYPDPKLTPHLYLGYWAPKESWAIWRRMHCAANRREQKTFLAAWPANSPLSVYGDSGGKATSGAASLGTRAIPTDETLANPGS